jgi:histidine ammonia-lyase
MSKAKKTGGTTRRQFTKSLALVAATPLMTSPAEVAAQEPKQAEPPADAAAALTELARIRFGKHVDEDMLKQIRRGLEGRQRSAERLKQFKLTPGDEPAFVFSASVP